MKKLALALALTGMLSFTATFAASSSKPADQGAGPHLYVFLGAGYADQESMPSAADFTSLSGVDNSGTTDRDDQQMGGRAGIGLMWNTFSCFDMGVELAGAIYGSEKYSNGSDSIEFNYYGIELLGVGQLNFDKFHIIGKLGVTNERLHPAKENVSNDNITSTSTVNPEVGLGIGFTLTSQSELNLTAYHVVGNDVSFNSDTAAVNLPSIDSMFLQWTRYIG